MMISFIKGEKATQTYLALCKKIIAPLLNHDLTVINHIFWNAELNFTSHTRF